MMDAIPVLEAVEEPLAEEPCVEAAECSVLRLTELLLKDPARVDRLTRREDLQPELIPRFLAIALASFSAFSLAMILMLDTVSAEGLPPILKQGWSGTARPAFGFWLAYTF